MEFNSSIAGKETYGSMLNDYSIDTDNFRRKHNGDNLKISDFAVIYKSITDIVQMLEGSPIETYINKTLQGIIISLYHEGELLHQTLFRTSKLENEYIDFQEYFINECKIIHEKIRLKEGRF